MFLIAYQFAELRSWSRSAGGESHQSYSRSRSGRTALSWSGSSRHLRWRSACRSGPHELVSSMSLSGGLIRG